MRGEDHPQAATLWAKIIDPVYVDPARLLTESETHANQGINDLGPAEAYKTKLDKLPEEMDK